MKTLDFKGFPVDYDIHLDSKLNIQILYVGRELYYVNKVFR